MNSSENNGTREVICMTCNQPYLTAQRNPYPLCETCIGHMAQEHYDQFADALGLPKSEEL